MTKQILRIGMAVMTTLLLLVVLWRFQTVVLYVLISLILSATLRPLVIRLVGARIWERVAWICAYLVALSSFGFLFYLTGQTAIHEIQQLSHTVSVQDVWQLPVWLRGSSVQQILNTWLPPPSQLFEAVTGSQGQHVLPAILGFTQGFGNVAGGLVIILFLSIYWSMSQIHFERLWLSLLPSGQRKQARGIWRTVEPDIGAYVRSQVIQSLLTGLVLGLGYWLIGSPYPALLALAGALACLIPLVGGVLVVIPVLFVGLLTSLQLSLFTACFALVVLIALGVWVRPRLYDRRWDNPLLTLVLLIAMANIFGLLGILVAPPLSAVCQILWSRLVSHRLPTGAAAQVSDLKERQERIRASIRAMDEPPPPLVTSSMERLTRLITRAEPLLQASLPADLSDPRPLPQPAVAKDEPPASIKS
jgi:predicted PurR-regulated permease PerM